MLLRHGRHSPPAALGGHPLRELWCELDERVPRLGWSAPTGDDGLSWVHPHLAHPPSSGEHTEVGIEERHRLELEQQARPVSDFVRVRGGQEQRR